MVIVHKMSEVITPLDNMAEIIRKKPSTSLYSKLLERFSAPFYDPAATSNYNANFMELVVDSVYQKRYFSNRSQGGNVFGGRP